MSPLQLYNTRTRAKQTFVPADASGQVGLFVCGPTVYDLPQLGHAKTYTQFDILVPATEDESWSKGADGQPRAH
jgi:cysteinyl-tRNA synthetase